MKPSVLKNISFLNQPATYEITKKFLDLVPTSADFNDNLNDIEVIYTHFSRLNYSFYPKLKVVLSPCSGIGHLLEDKPDSVDILYLDDEKELFKKAVSSAEWAISSMLRLLINDNENLQGKKIGFLGFNRMAQQIAARLMNFGIEMTYFEPDLKSNFLYVCESLVKTVSTMQLLCNTSDIIFACLPDKSEYTNFISETAFAEMYNVYFINPFRSHIVDGEDMVDAFEHKHLKGIAINDATGYEPETMSTLCIFGNMKQANCIYEQDKAGRGQCSRFATDRIILNRLETYINKKS